MKLLIAFAVVVLAGLVLAGVSLPSVAQGRWPLAGLTPQAAAAGSGQSSLHLAELPLPSEPVYMPPLAPAGWTELMTQGFEGAFPAAGWTLYGDPTWGRTNYRKSNGSYSAYGAAGGSRGVAPPGPYLNGMNGAMIYGPFDLRGATAAEVTFQHWTKTEWDGASKHDDLCLLASKNGTNFYGRCWWGNWTSEIGAVNGWNPATFDLANVYYLGSLLGQSQVWIGFWFRSDSSVALEGAYVDDIVLRVHTGVLETPTPTATPGSCPGASSRSYITTEDNENNALTGTPDFDMYPALRSCMFRNHPLHPIEFRVLVDNPPSFSQAQLSLKVWDVDEQDNTCPEVDKVYLNNTHVGNLTGANNIWSTTVLDVLPSLVRTGSNLVQVYINTRNCEDPGQPQGWWCTAVNWGQLVLGGGGGPASIRAAAPDRTCYEPGATIDLIVEVDTTLTSQEVRVEVNILDAARNNLAGSTQTKVISGVQDDPFAFALPISGAAAPGDHLIQILVSDVCSDTQNGYREIPIRIDQTCSTATPVMTPTPTLTPSPTPTATRTPTATCTLTPQATPAPDGPRIYLPLALRSNTP